MAEKLPSYKEKLKEFQETSYYQTVREASGKKVIQLGVIGFAALISKLLEDLNKELFDFVITFLILLFIAILLGSVVFINYREKKLRGEISKEVEAQNQKRLKEWNDYCISWITNNEAMIFELKKLFDSKLITIEQKYEGIISQLKQEMENIFKIFWEERKTNHLILAMFSDVKDPYVNLEKKIMDVIDHDSPKT